MAGKAVACQLRISLDEVEPEVWRRIVVPGSLTLRELHAVIQGAMGWQDSHLHMFEIDGRRFQVPMDDSEESDDDYDDERKAVLGKVLSKGTRFLYTYDFGDDWNHSLVVEDMTPSAADRMPICAGGEGACPPEDCGGPFGYPEFLQALADSKHPEHLATVAWAGGFRSDHFNVTQANALIAATCALYHERGWGFESVFGR